MSLRAGDTVEHFVIVSPLGEGGMGQVYVARDTRLQRSIALKIMQPEAAGDASGKGASNGAARLLREAQSAAGLEHPNVVTIYEVGEIKGEGEEAGRPFIAMELVKGKPLRAFVGDERVPMKERIRWLADIARALAAAHKAGLVHRDIKPENVMVRDDGVVKVLDFGLAKRAASTSSSVSSSTEAQVLPSLTGKGVAIGTPYYMAPEQMRNEVLDGRADQFAWGVVAYELLSGSPAWGRDIGALELVSKLLSEDPMPLMELRPDVPAHVATAVTRAMAKRRASRFGTMEEVISALEDPGGVFAPTMPRISLSSPELGEAPQQQTIEPRSTTTVSLRKPQQRRLLLGVVAASLASMSTMAIVAATRLGGRAPVASASATPSASISPAAGFPDFGSPMSKSVDATSAYRKGVRAVRDADAEGAARELNRAVTLDPELAAAHLRLGLRRIPLGRSAREHAREALRLRDGLGPHDQILLDAVAPLLDVPQNYAEAAKRLSGAVDREPTDADFTLNLCRTLQAETDFRGARDVCMRAGQLDPGAAAPLLEAALVQERLEDVPGALALFDACLRASPLATSCLEPTWQLQTYEGSCADALTTARRIVSLQPDSADAYDRLAVALAGAGESVESVRAALAQKLEHLSPDEAAIAKLRDGAMLDLAIGDFADANVRLRGWEAASSSSRFEGDHVGLTGTRITLAEEEGKNAEAVSLASAYLKQRPAWTLGTEDDFSFYFFGQLYALGALPRSDFVVRRTKWLAVERARASSWRFPWVDAYAIPAMNEADAREALEALPGLLPLPDRLNGTPEWETPIGETYRLAGRDAEAIPFLSHAAASCALLEAPIEQTTASLYLGQALEKLGQLSEACDAYRVVTRRWSKARTSTSAAKARERAKALRCKVD